MEKGIRLPPEVVEVIRETAKEIFGKGVKLWPEKICEQRVDLVLKPFNDDSFISKKAKEEGVRLL